MEQENLDRYLPKAEAGDAEAMYWLAHCYKEDKDYEKAEEWYEKSAKQGYGNAQKSLAGLYYRLGSDYKEGENGVNKDYAKALEWYRKAIRAYNISLLKTNDAKRWVASSASDYFFVLEDWNKEAKALEEKGNYEQAVKEYIRAEECGSGLAQIGLARCYSDGKGVEQDTARAIAYYEKAIQTLKSDKPMASLMLMGKDKIYKFFFKQWLTNNKLSIKLAKDLMKIAKR